MNGQKLLILKLLTFRSTFITSRYNYMINDECLKGEEVE